MVIDLKEKTYCEGCNVTKKTVSWALFSGKDSPRGRGLWLGGSCRCCGGCWEGLKDIDEQRGLKRYR